MNKRKTNKSDKRTDDMDKLCLRIVDDQGNETFWELTNGTFKLNKTFNSKQIKNGKYFNINPKKE